jgi:Domain of unknown function (DUF1772)
MFIAKAVAMLLVVAFALAFGGQMFDTFVNVPLYFGDPPASISDSLKWPTTQRVPDYFRRVVPLTLAAGIIGLALWITARPSAALLVSSSCALVYVGLIFLFFLPTNRKLGFLPLAAGESAPTADESVLLSRQWRTWNRVRLAVQLVGLVAAALSMST